MSDVNELLQEMAEGIAGKYHIPSEGTYDEARKMLLMVTDWMKSQGPAHRRAANSIELDMGKRPFRCPNRIPGCTKNCGDYGCGN